VLNTFIGFLLLFICQFVENVTKQTVGLAVLAIMTFHCFTYKILHLIFSSTANLITLLSQQCIHIMALGQKTTSEFILDFGNIN